MAYTEPKVEPVVSWAWCCGVPDGEVCAPSCPHAMTYNRIKTTAILVVAERAGKSERMAAEERRKANREVGEEIARNPPAWAYPLAWRLAVMADVERSNNTPDAGLVVGKIMNRFLTEFLRRYHDARLSGLTTTNAAFAAVSAGGFDPVWGALVCKAYERGRPGPGGVSVTRPA